MNHGCQNKIGHSEDILILYHFLIKGKRSGKVPDNDVGLRSRVLIWRLKLSYL